MLKSWTKSAIFGKEYKLNCLSRILCGFSFFLFTEFVVGEFEEREQPLGNRGKEAFPGC